MPKQKKKWIKGAVKNKGSLRNYVMNTYGSAGFTKDGKIRLEYLNHIIASKHTSRTTKARARLAKGFRKMRD